MNDINNATIHIFNSESGEEVIHASPVSQIEWCDKNTDPIDISTSYHFECDVKSTDSELKKLFKNSSQWRDACRLADELNDLIEEYHCPGLPRRERRAVKRQFDKIFRIFQKHCHNYMIDYKFIRTSKGTTNKYR